jgi:hypothetical protein
MVFSSACPEAERQVSAAAESGSGADAVSGRLHTLVRLSPCCCGLVLLGARALRETF